ncbi:MAG: hypothetical protein ABJ215_01125 [Alphaproteobacteria bacterium]
MRRTVEQLWRLKHDYRVVFSTPEGKRVLRDLNRFCMYAAPTADANEAVFTMGMQRVFRRIAAMARADEDAMLNEFQTGQENDDD